MPTLNAAPAAQGDWYGRVFAETLAARVMIDDHNAGAALKSLSAAEAIIPAGAPDAPDAGRPSGK